MRFLDYFNEEAQVIMERDPAIKSRREVLLYPSFWAIYKYRKAHKYYEEGKFYKARKISQKARRRTGIEIHPGARIGKGFFIDHGSGVVIGETTEIGDNVTLYQGVTLGGTGKEKGKRHPTIEDNVMISVGAKVLGSIRVGRNSKIGAGSVVLSDVPPYSTVVGIPGRVVKSHRVDSPSRELNQTNLPDPVAGELETLKKEFESLEGKIEELSHREEP